MDEERFRDPIFDVDLERFTDPIFDVDQKRFTDQIFDVEQERFLDQIFDVDQETQLGPQSSSGALDATVLQHFLQRYRKSHREPKKYKC